MASSDSAPLTASRDTPKEATEGSASSRYRLRAELRIVNGAAGGVTSSDVTIVDPRSDEQHVFTADEFRLCQAADSTNTLARIRQTFQAQTGREISYAKVLAFFRRLRSLGLLQDGAPDSGADKLAETGMGETAAPKSSGQLARPGGPTGPLDLTDTDDFGAAFDAGAGGALGAVLGRAAGRGLGGGALHNLLSGLAQRGRAERQRGVAEETTDANEPARVSLFNPNAALGLIAALTWPLKHALVPFLLLVAAAVAIAYRQREFLAQDIRSFDVSVVGTIILGLSIASFIARLTQGTFIRGFGAEVKQFGIRAELWDTAFFC